MKLSKRLEAIASFVSSDGAIIDVGCNHAHIPIYFASKEPERIIIASDCKLESLNNAFKDAKKYKVKEKIQFIVTDGLNGIKIHPEDTIIIAGLGTRTIKKILTPEVLNQGNHFILQSNNYLYELRLYMMQNQFLLKDESVVWEGNKVYVVMNWVKVNKPVSYSSFELQYGPCILHDKNRKYMMEQYNILMQQLNKVKGSNHPEIERVYLKEIEKIKKLEWF